MNYTKQEIEKMADEYANQFIDGKDHFYGFKAGFEKALSLFAVSGRSEQLFAYSKALTPNADDKLIREFIDEYLKANNSH